MIDCFFVHNKIAKIKVVNHNNRSIYLFFISIFVQPLTYIFLLPIINNIYIYLLKSNFTFSGLVNFNGAYKNLSIVINWNYNLIHKRVVDPYILLG